MYIFDIFIDSSLIIQYVFKKNQYFSNLNARTSVEFLKNCPAQLANRWMREGGDNGWWDKRKGYLGTRRGGIT